MHSVASHHKRTSAKPTHTKHHSKPRITTKRVQNHHKVLNHHTFQKSHLSTKPQEIIEESTVSSDVSSQLSPSVLSHNTIEQYNQLRITNKLNYGSNIIVNGWLRSIRNQGQLTFITINDGSNSTGLQTVFDASWTNDQTISLLRSTNIPLGSAVKIQGEMLRNERQPHESATGWEIRAHNLEIEGICDVHGYTPPKSTQQIVDNEDGDDGDKILDKKEKKKLKKLQKAAAELAALEKANTLQYTPSQLPNIETYSLEPYPLQKKFQTLEYLRQHPDTRLRTNTYAALQRVRSQSIVALHNHFVQDGFVCVQPPLITPCDCEGGGDLFSVTTSKAEDALQQQQQQQQDQEQSTETKSLATTTGKKNPHFFGRPAFLSVSGQLYAEIAASSLRRVYSFGPTFRAENSHTSRHLAEFWMLEPEMAFATLDEVCSACELSIQNTIKTLLQNPSTKGDLEFFQNRYDETLLKRLEKISTTPFGRITYTDALIFLQKHVDEGKVTFENNQFIWGSDLQTEHEKYLASYYDRPVFVTNYPAKIKPFYMKIDDNSILSHDTTKGLSKEHSISTNIHAWKKYGDTLDVLTKTEKTDQNIEEISTLEKNILTIPELTDENTERMTVACFDLLVPGMGELCGGSQREERLEVLLQRVKQFNLPVQEYQWYIDLRRFGTTQHGGWGMGFERFLAYVTGTDNVRDTMLIPRAPGLMQL